MLSNNHIQSFRQSSQSNNIVPCTVTDGEKYRQAQEWAPFMPQAGTFCYETPDADQTTRGTLAFIDNNPSYTCEVSSNNDSTRNSTNDENTSLSNFFERPIQIAAYDWAVNGDLDAVINPWSLWAANPRVANRLSNFRNFRGNMHIKVILNGNSFYWGRALLSYMPLPKLSPWYRTTGDADIMTASQRPHIYLDPTTSQGGHMVLPFYCADDCIDMTIVNEFRDFGELWLRSISQLRQASGLTQAVDVKIYAWVENIQLTSPTSVAINGLTPQAGDEYGDGPISRPANIISKVAGALENVPAVAPLAMATQMAAKGIGKLAASVGYSRPRNISNIDSVRIWQTGDLALSDTNVTNNSLSMVAKNEVTLDPRTVGLGDADEMDFSYLAAKESYLVSADWGLNESTNTVIISLPVTPVLRRINNDALFPLPGMVMAPMGLVATPFKFWRGSIKYRFQIAASGYHKGRILAVWDPVDGTSSPETNVVYSKIIDIAETKDFSITIGWGGTSPGLDVGDLPVANMFTTAIPFTPSLDKHNGSLTLYVLNSLVTSGSATNPVQVITSVSSPELEVWSPDPDNMKELSAFPPPSPVLAEAFTMQAGNEMSDATGQSENAAPEGTGMDEYAGGKAVDITLPAILAGESIVSYRQLLKRFCFERVVGRSWTATTSSFVHSELPVKSYPFYRGHVPNGLHSYAGNTINSSPTTPFNFIAACFASFRGSVRYKVFPSMGNAKPDSLFVSRGDIANLTASSVAYANNINNLSLFRSQIDESFGGSQYSNAVQGNVLDFEIPYYAKRRFSTVYSPNTSSIRALGAKINAIKYPDGTTETKEQTFDLYKAVGEDFNFFFFTGGPTWWIVPITATP